MGASFVIAVPWQVEGYSEDEDRRDEEISMYQSIPYITIPICQYIITYTSNVFIIMFSFWFRFSAGLVPACPSNHFDLALMVAFSRAIVIQGDAT